MTTTACEVDVLIVGAGISGIGLAAHMERARLGRSYMLLERRANLGGTWDLFRYPGIRSDSDMHTLSYEFEPWTGKETLAAATRIQDYLAGVVTKYGIDRHIRYGQKVLSADFDSARACWKVTVEDDAGWHEITANWLYLAAGYYDYDKPYDPPFEGEAEFPGPLIHAQLWPEDLDYAGKRVAVIGSGATAITVVPNMAELAAKVTMVQRTPTYIRSIPGHDRIGRFLRRIMPVKTAFRLTRWLHIVGADKMYRTAREKPDEVRANLDQQTRELLGEHYRPEDFTPPYAPWDQRMCFIPDADLFEGIKSGKVDIVTGHIERFSKDGIVMTDGRTVEADIIIKATGLQLLMGGGITLSVDDKRVEPGERFYYKNCMISGVPNLAHPVPYTNTGSTLRYDLVSDYVCRVLKHMAKTDTTIATPTIPEGTTLEPHDSFAVEAGYVKRAVNALPMSTLDDPWRLNHDYLHDRKYMRAAPIDDGLLVFARPGDNTRAPEERLEAAE
ncbi:FAD-containing monooxygenase EthA [Tsuneonella dongtanensis]|uniref:FAD-containing monooxygenase EthA n=1 Tax=Tsuneonella dongtanensis TaxID=692370 RepID=A0A1B2ABJ1_9SPHN|nr:NAD(P)/FAD-dependent oxidoreductase [Tsuneonella dongtanensis]ANY19464.1 FAD-containing monooxygenase EthA [Tsuneonella dongtanensis]